MRFFFFEPLEKRTVCGFLSGSVLSETMSPRLNVPLDSLEVVAFCRRLMLRCRVKCYISFKRKPKDMKSDFCCTVKLLSASHL